MLFFSSNVWHNNCFKIVGSLMEYDTSKFPEVKKSKKKKIFTTIAFVSKTNASAWENSPLLAKTVAFPFPHHLNNKKVLHLCACFRNFGPAKSFDLRFYGNFQPVRARCNSQSDYQIRAETSAWQTELKLLSCNRNFIFAVKYFTMTVTLS